MPAPSWEDLGAFLQTDDDGGFATVAVVTLQGGAVRNVTGIFDDPYLDAQLGEYVADTSSPRFTCRESDTAGIGRGAEIVIGGKTYDIMTAPQSDGVGMATLRLEPR